MFATNRLPSHPAMRILSRLTTRRDSIEAALIFLTFSLSSRFLVHIKTTRDDPPYARDSPPLPLSPLLTFLK